MTILSSITHTDILIAFIAVLLVATYLYLKIKKIDIGGSIILDHWGDCIGLFLILLGVGIILIAPIYKNEINSVQVITTGSGLITAGFVALKLKTVPDSSAGNNGGTRTTESHTLETIPVAPASATSLSAALKSPTATVVKTETDTIVQPPPPPTT